MASAAVPVDGDDDSTDGDESHAGVSTADALPPFFADAAASLPEECFTYKPFMGAAAP
jgi:hypothetical protein